ncbi:hypothetical protein EXIGLDRAFT_708228 [Exidia glandulosa HHB12029]|uniref:MYND-type domain-containing protein n=1 Tax=Exidia glandulosa HHB12029 TaxID=1314781 RepID=A0A166N870_EXIGL|nr:hypothetical protein EXIGLDRAFT_708228 [Exidia glandulosa HHB12029]
MSLVLGLVPSAYIDGYTTLSTAHQIMFSRMQSDDANSHERIVWRRTPHLDQSLLHFDKPSELAELLHKVYYEMFDCEDIALARQVKSGVKSNSILQRMSNITYTRHSFVSLLAAFRRRLSPETDWTSVANGIVDRVGRDNRLIIGMNSYQDLCAHLHAAGLLDVVPLYHSPQVPQDVYKSRTVFANWSDEEIGHLVYVGLRIRVRDMARAEGLASPLLFTVRTPAALNYSATFYALHGSVTVDPTSKTFDVQTSSDRSHDVIAIARVPAWTLMVDPDTTTVEMGVRPGALNGPAIFRTLGMSMAVFSAPLVDTANVFFSRSPPTVGGVPLAPFIEEYVPSVSNSELEMRTVSVTLDSRREGVASLTLREDVTGEEERAKWTDKVDVRAVQVSSTDGVVETVCGTFSRPLHFTLTVDLKDAKLRIARKSFYVEVVAPVARIVPPSALPMHRVILDRLPIAEDRTNHPMKWLDMHGQFSFSDRERANRERFFNGGRVPFVEFKDDLFVLLMRCAGFQNPVRVFFLLDESKGSGSDFLAQTHAVIFVSALKWDSTASTIVADAYVISHPDEETLEMLAASGVKAGQLPHPHATATLWDKMLIGFAKRCGNGTWFHKASCSRPTAALCGCGAGVDVGGFKAVKEWKGVPAEKVTRAAIGMLFAPHFLENVGGHMPNFATSMGIPVARPPPTGTTSSRVHVPVSATTAEPAGQCARCGNDARLECPKCGKVKYCDKNCMRVHAKAHKSACK